jgi:alginate O-acetyltransferase complex protein AlgI
MLFQSQIFILGFLPLALTAYYLGSEHAPVRQWTLIATSLLFYAWWDFRFIPLLLGQIVASWLCANVHEATGRRSALFAGIAVNLLSLATFKYLNFLEAIITSATGIALPRSNLILPIGISFFSFQLISYLVDRLRGDAPIYPLRPFALFVLFFPHLVAGPIVRHNELIPQFAQSPRNKDMWQKIAAGLVIFTVGFAKKVALADQLALKVDPLFARLTQGSLNFGEAWTAALGFSFQLFLDFSAYTEMAIGIALLYGLILPENFRRPYLASDLREFWQRWHISLSRFIRDYLYIPMGGSRNGRLRYVVATLGSMAICGLWHGAGWTFVAWGVWHGIGLVVCRAWGSLKKPLPTSLGWVLTMLFVLVGWVLFRSDSFNSAMSLLLSLSGTNGLGGAIEKPALFVAAAIASVLIPSAYEMKDRLLKPTPALAVAGGILAVYCFLEVGRGAPVNFIYFQF